MDPQYCACSQYASDPGQAQRAGGLRRRKAGRAPALILEAFLHRTVGAAAPPGLVWTPAPPARSRPAPLTAAPGVLAAPERHFVPTPRWPRATGIHLLWCSALLRLWYVAVSRAVHLQYEVLSVSLLTMLPSTYIAHFQPLSSILFICPGAP